MFIKYPKNCPFCAEVRSGLVKNYTIDFYTGTAIRAGCAKFIWRKRYLQKLLSLCKFWTKFLKLMNWRNQNKIKLTS